MLTESPAAMANSSGDWATSGPCVPSVQVAGGVTAAQPTPTPARVHRAGADATAAAAQVQQAERRRAIARARDAAGAGRAVAAAARALSTAAAGHARAHETLTGGSRGRAAEALAVHADVALD